MPSFPRPIPTRLPCVCYASSTPHGPPSSLSAASTSLGAPAGTRYSLESSIKPLRCDILPLQAKRYDFSPLLTFLSTRSPAVHSSALILDPAELSLVEAYRAVPGPLWHSLLKSLCSSSIPLAHDMVSWLQHHKLCFSYELLYSILIHAMGKSEQLYEAFLLSQKHALNPLTYNALISACVRNNDLDKALNLISRMRADGFPSDFVNYSLIIQALIRNKRIDSILLQRILREIEMDHLELDPQLSNDLITGFAKAGDPSRALQCLGIVQGNGLSPKTSTMIAVISSLGNSGRVEEAEAMFEEMKDNGQKPRTKAYNALLKSYVKSKNLKDAELIVSEMRVSGVSPDSLTYGLLIDAYVAAGKLESVKFVVKQMEPSSFIFSRILSAYRDRGEWQMAFQVVKDMKSCGVKPDRQFYNVMIDTFGKFHCVEHAMDTYQRMVSEGIDPDTVTWNSLLDCHCKAGKHEEAEALFEEMSKRGIAPCPTTFNIMINSFGAQQRWDDVRALFSDMRGRGILPTTVTYTTLIDVYGKSGRFDDAVDCLETFKSEGLSPSSAMYNALINAYAQKGLSDMAVEAFRSMTEDGLKPSIVALNSLINAFGEDRRDAEAFAVVQYMKENGLKPDVVSYTTLMKALIRVDKLNQVPDVYEEMIASGCTPDRKAKAMLRSALRYMKRTLSFY